MFCMFDSSDRMYSKNDNMMNRQVSPMIAVCVACHYNNDVYTRVQMRVRASVDWFRISTSYTQDVAFGWWQYAQALLSTVLLGYLRVTSLTRLSPKREMRRVVVTSCPQLEPRNQNLVQLKVKPG